MPTTCAARTAVPVAVSSAVPVAVSSAVAPLLQVRARGTVLATFPAAVYVGLPSGAVLAVVTSDGLRLPNALVVSATSRDAPLPRPVSAVVRDGALVLDDVAHRPVRSWAPRRTTAGELQRRAVDELAVRLAAAPPHHTGDVAVRLRAGAADLHAALRTGTGCEDAADALLGLGPGLTPAGDDVLAGALVTCVHLGRSAPEHHRTTSLAARVRERADATVALSADLLRHACAGGAAPPLPALLDALTGARPVAPALAGLLAVGSSSGADTATGVLLAAQALLARREAA